MLKNERKLNVMVGLDRKERKGNDEFYSVDRLVIHHTMYATNDTLIDEPNEPKADNRGEVPQPKK